MGSSFKNKIIDQGQGGDYNIFKFASRNIRPKTMGSSMRPPRGATKKKVNKRVSLNYSNQLELTSMVDSNSVSEKEAEYTLDERPLAETGLF